MAPPPPRHMLLKAALLGFFTASPRAWFSTLSRAVARAACERCAEGGGDKGHEDTHSSSSRGRKHI
jgi:hypothetical protein